MACETPLPPDFRATVTRRGVMLLPWSPWLATGGPLGSLVRARGSRGVTLADVSVVRDDDDGVAREAIVDVIAGGGGAAREALIRWASSAGYERVWLPGEVVDTDPQRFVGGVAQTRCRNCGGSFADRRPEFWLSVRRDGHFPSACPICGGDLAQWSVAERQKDPYRPPSTGDCARG
jgi:hypothetical protein